MRNSRVTVSRLGASPGYLRVLPQREGPGLAPLAPKRLNAGGIQELDDRFQFV
jgi:hypothetical protein